MTATPSRSPLADELLVTADQQERLAAWARTTAEHVQREWESIEAQGGRVPPQGTPSEPGDTPRPPAPGDPEPQVGEVWEDTDDGERVLILTAPVDGQVACEVLRQGRGAPDRPGSVVGRPIPNGDGWRRVEPAPGSVAPASEDHLASGSGGAGGTSAPPTTITPATDEQIAQWERMDGIANELAVEGHPVEMRVRVLNEQSSEVIVRWTRDGEA